MKIFAQCVKIRLQYTHTKQTKETHMELINAISTYFQSKNDEVKNITVVGRDCWFSIGSTHYTCSIVRGKFLKKNSIRLSVA